MNWLFSEAGAGWIFGLLSTVGLVATYLRRKRPRQLAIRELYHSSLVRVRPDARKRIAVTFDGSPVKNPGQFDLEISNEGTEVIHRPRFEIVFPQATTLLEAVETEDSSTADINLLISGSVLNVDLPFLNPVREHKQRVKLSLIVDGADQSFSVRGGGEGWSIRYVPSRDPAGAFSRIKWLSATTVVVLILWIPYLFWVQSRFGIGLWETSVRSLLVSLPFAIPLVGLQFAIARITYGRVRSFAISRRPT